MQCLSSASRGHLGDICAGGNAALALVTVLHAAIVQQSLPFRCTAFLLRTHQSSAARYPGQQGAVQSIIEPCAQQQDQEAEHLEAVEHLPAQGQADHPDDQRTQAVQHHACGGADLLGDADPGEVEEGDADRVAQQSKQDKGLVANLTEGVQRVLQHLTRVVTKLTNGNEVHGDEEQRQDEEAKKTWRRRMFVCCCCCCFFICVCVIL